MDDVFAIFDGLEVGGGGGGGRLMMIGGGGIWTVRGVGMSYTLFLFVDDFRLVGYMGVG